MSRDEIRFCEGMVKGYLGKCFVTLYQPHAINEYHQVNVKYHTNDIVWLKSYVLNRVYDDFTMQHEALSAFHEYVNTKEFIKVLREHEEQVIDSYVKYILQKLNLQILNQYSEEKRTRTVMENIAETLHTYLGMDINVARSKILTKKQEIEFVVNNLLDKFNKKQEKTK